MSYYVDLGFEQKGKVPVDCAEYFDNPFEAEEYVKSRMEYYKSRGYKLIWKRTDAAAECECGREVICTSFVNECSCGNLYGKSAQRLHRDSMPERKLNFGCFGMKANLNELLETNFGSGYEREESPCCESYSKLISLLYDLSELEVIDNVNEIVEALDDISTENAFRDYNGEIICEADEIDRRNAYDKVLEKSYELYKKEWCEKRGHDISAADEETGINGECYVCSATRSR